jgi:hypothetical protein
MLHPKEDANIRSLRVRIQVTEHDEREPWLIVSSHHEEVELPDDVAFFRWVAEHYPKSRYSVDPDPWAMSPKRFKGRTESPRGCRAF